MCLGQIPGLAGLQSQGMPCRLLLSWHPKGENLVIKLMGKKQQLHRILSAIVVPSIFPFHSFGGLFPHILSSFPGQSTSSPSPPTHPRAIGNPSSPLCLQMVTASVPQRHISGSVFWGFLPLAGDLLNLNHGMATLVAAKSHVTQDK